LLGIGDLLGERTPVMVVLHRAAGIQLRMPAVYLHVRVPAPASLHRHAITPSPSPPPLVLTAQEYAKKYHDFMTLMDLVDQWTMRKLDTDPATLAHCQGLPLDQLLAAPVDRPIAYLMMFSPLLQQATAAGSPDAPHLNAAVAGLQGVCGAVSEGEGAAFMAILSRGLGTQLQFVASRCHIAESSFDFALTVTQGGKPAPAWGDAAAVASVVVPSKTLTARSSGRVWLFNDAAVVAAADDAGLRYFITIPLVGAVVASAADESGALQSLTVASPPTGAADVTAAGQRAPLAASDAVVVVATGEHYRLQLWVAPEDGSPAAAADAAARLTVWQGDLELVGSGRVAGDALLSRYRSIQAREAAIANYQAATAAAAAAKAAGGAGATFGSPSPSGVGKLATDADVIREIAGLGKVPDSIYDMASFASPADASTMYARVVDCSVSKGVLMEGKVEKKGGLMTGNKPRYLIARVTLAGEEGVEGELEAYDNAADAAKGTNKGKDSYPLSTLTHAAYANDAGQDKYRGAFVVEFGDAKLQLKADTDEEVRGGGCGAAVCRSMEGGVV